MSDYERTCIITYNYTCFIMLQLSFLRLTPERWIGQLSTLLWHACSFWSFPVAHPMRKLWYAPMPPCDLRMPMLTTCLMSAGSCARRGNVGPHHGSIGAGINGSRWIQGTRAASFMTFHWLKWLMSQSCASQDSQDCQQNLPESTLPGCACL